MMNKEVSRLLNDQINKEFYSAYLYMDMANYYAEQNLKGFENWFYVQMQEERDHALLFRQYLLNNAQPVTLQTIAAPDKARIFIMPESDFSSPFQTIVKLTAVHYHINTLCAFPHYFKHRGCLSFADHIFLS
jgi:ferritin